MPDGYERTTGDYETGKVVEDEKTSYIIEIKPSEGKPVRLEIIVRDEETGEAVAGAVVKVTAPSGTVTEYTTDSEGRVLIENTVVGTYEVSISRVPDGYHVTIGDSASVDVVANTISTHIVEINTSSLDRQPATGDTMNLASLLLIILLCAAVMSFSVYTKKKIEK